MTNIIEQNVVTTLRENFMPYTAYVILERALPEIDGFKPSQRRILYTMYRMGLLNGGRKKSQGIVGQTMFYHPHGDGAIYETLVRMARDSEALLIPFIDSKGNFGKQYSRDMQYASARYTEVRLEPVSKELFRDIDKDTVDMIDNYDGTLKEPKLLPVTFPTILTNPQIGTAVGMASSIAPFNLKEIVDYTIAYIKNPKTEISEYVKAPDFPTGGNIVKDDNVISNILNNGRGTITIRSTYTINGDSIIFRDIPYTTTFEAVMDKIRDLVKEGKIKDIVEIDDIMGINGKGIDITVKKNTDKELLIEKLFKMTPLQSTFSCNFNLIINGRPQVLGVKGIIHEWLAFRAKSIRRGATFEKNKKEHKRQMLLALKKVLLDVDKAIAIIRGTKKNAEVVANLINAFDISEDQAEFVADIKLKHLNEEYLVNRISEISDLENEIKELEDLITNRVTLAKLITSQLEEIKQKYGTERKSQLISISDIPTVEKEAIEVEDYNVKLFVTKEGYLKKIPLTSLRGNFNIKVKDGDEIVKEFETTNNSDILVFTDKQNVYKRKAYEFEDHKPSQLGDYLQSYLELKDENILFVTVTNDYSGQLIVGFDDGKVAKIELSAYQTKQNRSMLKNAYANKEAVYFNHIFEDIDLVAVSSIDKVLLFDTSMINSKTSKTTIGVQIQKSKNDSKTVEYILASEFETDDLEYYRVKSAGIGKYRK